MADILGVGISHWPRLHDPDHTFAKRVRANLQHPEVPDEIKDKRNWPAGMQAEWGDDEGLSNAPAHREAILKGIRKVRSAIDDFKPDAIVVWGDDQYENFREDIIPPFCVLAFQEDLRVRPHSVTPNPWNESHEKEFLVRSAPEISKALVSGLLESSFDMAYAYKPLHDGLSHAFVNAMLYLDYDRKGFDYPMIPVTVNCYGSNVICNKGTVPKINRAELNLDPPAPSPARCFELGRATARILRASPWRIALLASSSWSHAFLVAKHWQMRPDTVNDRRLYNALVAGDYSAWRDTPLADIVDAGQHEVLNWFCLAGAMCEINGQLKWHDFVETFIYNSNKVSAVYAPVPGNS